MLLKRKTAIGTAIWISPDSLPQTECSRWCGPPLYALVAWSGWRVYNAPGSTNRSLALRLWFSQLSTNARWSKLFFGKHRPDLALSDLLILEGFVLGYIAAARDVDRAAAQAFIPYAAWLAFAGLLNAEIVRRNPSFAEAATA